MTDEPKRGVRGRPRKEHQKQLCCRLPHSVYAKIIKMAEERGEKASDVMRRLIHQGLEVESNPGLSLVHSKLDIIIARLYSEGP